MWYNTTTLAYSYRPINCKVASALIKQAYNPYLMAYRWMPGVDQGYSAALGRLAGNAVAPNAPPPAAGSGPTSAPPVLAELVQPSSSAGAPAAVAGGRPTSVPPVLAELVQPSPSAGTTVAIVNGRIVDPSAIANSAQPPSAKVQVGNRRGKLVRAVPIADVAKSPPTKIPAPTTGGGGSVLPKGQPTPPRLQPGPAGTPLTRKEFMRMLNKALRKRPPGMGFGGSLMWTALGGLGGVLLDRLLSSGGKKHEPSYYAPYIPGYRLY